MEKLNANIILCEEVDEVSGSFINIFDKVKYNSDSVNFNVVVLTNSFGKISKLLHVVIIKKIEGKKGRALKLGEITIDQKEKSIEEQSNVFVVEDSHFDKGNYQIRIYSTSLDSDEFDSLGEVIKNGNLESISRFKVE